ncbi:RHS repeat-associated core domain-containing protein [Longibacter salinarum]
MAEEFGLNWYQYGTRYYDASLARWVEMDPADKFHTPYTYVGGIQ